VKVSVAVIVYNQRLYIEQAIESVLAQQLDADWELVIGDDCSTDGTTECLLQFRDRHPGRIKLLLAQENAHDRGRTNFVNTLSACSGEYIAYLDGDDYWLDEHKLAAQAGYLEANPEASACVHPVQRLYGDGRTDIFAPHSPSPEYALSQLYRNHSFLNASAFMYRSSVILPLPDWFADDRIRLDDWTLSVICARAGPIGYIEGLLGVYRKHGGGIWSAIDASERLFWDLQTRAYTASNLEGLAPPSRLGRSFHGHMKRYEAAQRDGRDLKARWQLSLAALCFPYRRSFSLEYVAIFTVELWLGFLKPALLALRRRIRPAPGLP